MSEVRFLAKANRFKAILSITQFISYLESLGAGEAKKLTE